MKQKNPSFPTCLHSNRLDSSRPLLRRQELPFLLVLALLLGAFFLYSKLGPRSGRPKVRICCENEILVEFPLGSGEERDYTFPEAPGVSIRLERNGGIRFLCSDCRDQICVRAGILRRAGDFAACLPNKISLSVIGIKEAPDSPDIVIGDHK